MFTVGTIASLLFDWAPASLAWERDNVGLLVGDPGARVERALVTLDVTPEVIAEAVAKKCTLIVSHHPLMFSPVKKLLATDPQGRMIADLVRNDIALIAMHTNADAASTGVNVALARALNLTAIEPLDPASRSCDLVRIPVDAAALPGIAAQLKQHDIHRWTAVPASDGTVTMELDLDSRLREDVRAICRNAGVDASTARVLSAGSCASGSGMGAIGDLEQPVPASKWLMSLGEKLHCRGLRTSICSYGATIRRVAVCGGAGHALIATACAQGADAFVTSDLSYHDFQDHGRSILLVDAGHFETEYVFIAACIGYLREASHADGIEFLETTVCTNPVSYYV